MTTAVREPIYLTTLGGTAVENNVGPSIHSEQIGGAIFMLGVVVIVFAFRGRKEKDVSAVPNSFRSHPAEG